MSEFYDHDVPPHLMTEQKTTQCFGKSAVYGILGAVISLLVIPLATVLLIELTGEAFWTMFYGSVVAGITGVALGWTALSVNKKTFPVGEIKIGRILGVFSIIIGSIGFTVFGAYLMFFGFMWAIG